MSRKTKEVKAQFHFVCMEPDSLTCDIAHQALMDTFLVAGPHNDDRVVYKKFRAVIEDNGQLKDSGKPLKSWDYPLPGYGFRATVSPTQKTLKRKYYDEREHKRVLGHVSTHPPEQLTKDTLAIIIGSPEFLSINAVLYFERTGKLREELLDVLVMIAGLSPRVRREKNANTYVHPVRNQKFYYGDFDALLEEIKKSQRMNTTDLEHFLANRTNTTL